MFAASKTAAAAAGTPPPSTDPQFNYVTMLLHGDGTNGAQNNTFVDSSTNNFTITRNGTPTQGSFSPYGTLWSNQFSGTNQFLTTPSNAAFDFGTGDFTVEFWVNCQNTGLAAFVGTRTADGSNTIRWCLYANNGSLEANIYDTLNSLIGTITFQNALPINTWVHCALVRSGVTFRLYQDGVQSTGSATSSAAVANSSTMVRIGDFNSSFVSDLNGYVSNLRIVKGTAVYTSAFTPSTTPLTAVSGTSLLTCQSNRFRDNSSNNFAITVTGTPSVQRFSPFDPAAEYSTSVIGGSGYFNGSAQYLSVPDNASLEFGSGEFCIEGWGYLPSSSGVSILIGKRASSSFDTGFIIYRTGTTLVFCASSNGSTWSIINNVSFGSMSLNAWNHFAVYRVGNAWYGAVNGIVTVLAASNSSAIVDTTSPVYIGADVGLNYWLGYLSNIRLVKGAAIYTSANFIPPTAPLTAVTNTSLLLNTVNAGIFDNAMMNDLVTEGNAQVSTAVKKYGTGSMYFDGSGDTLSLSPSPNIELGSGNFTIELWVNFISAPSSPIEYLFWQSQNHASGFKRLQFYIYQNQIAVGYFGTNVALSAALTWNTGQWYHLAVVRNGSSWTIYRDGVSVATGTNTQTLDAASGYSIGASINGYMDEYRITKGIARYTANFTPPTAALPNN